MSDVNDDFARLQETAQHAASGFDMYRSHPIFSAAHSFILAHRYGQEDPWTYMNNPGLRAMDTRHAALQELQRIGSAGRWQGNTAPTVPSPAAPKAAGPAGPYTVNNPPPVKWPTAQLKSPTGNVLPTPYSRPMHPTASTPTPPPGGYSKPMTP